jgi:diguanylate cyclase (GGDEF)-like protein
MNMKKPKLLKYCKLFSMQSLVVLIIILLSYWYVNLIKDERKSLQSKMNFQRAVSVKEQLSSMIIDKKKSTTAIAISIANDSSLSNNIEEKKIDENYYTNLIKSYKKHTLYQNIWIQILDKDLNSLYKSWDNKNGTAHTKSRSDLIKVFMSKKPLYSISSDEYDLSIKAITPILKDNKLVGILEVSSHFNSISKSLLKFGVESVVVLNKEDSQLLTKPFTHTFIGDYYIANKDIPDDIFSYITEDKIQNYLTTPISEENGYLISSYPLKDVDKKVIAHYLTFEKLNKISTSDLDFFLYKWSAVGIIVLMSIGIIIILLLFYSYRKDKKYYKNIINTSNSIIVITNKSEMIEVNETFFKYFHMYETLDDFKKEHSCICDFFISEEGCITTDIEGMAWLDFLVQNNKVSHKVKVVIDHKEFYFSLSANLVDKKNNYYSIIMFNVSEQEMYKKDLERLTITDALSKVYNRRYFELTIDEEISRAKRYKYPVSLIILDIDFFKKVNDKYGHKVGDEVIIEYASFISSMLRDEDTFCRIGGEEFAIVLPHLDKGNAYKVAEKLRDSVESHKKIMPITMSFGLAEYIMGETYESIFHRADKALYKAKDSGRNRVKVG